MHELVDAPNSMKAAVDVRLQRIVSKENRGATSTDVQVSRGVPCIQVTHFRGTKCHAQLCASYFQEWKLANICNYLGLSLK